MIQLKEKKTKKQLPTPDRKKYEIDNYEMYDIIIIGGGISGLYCAYNLLKKNKNLKVLVLEKNPKLGGRVSTFYGGKDDKEVSKDIIFEKGAGRFNDNHTQLNGLLDELGLSNKKFKITNVDNTIWMPKNKFQLLREKYPRMDNILEALQKQLKENKVSQEEIRKHNLQELVKKYLVYNDNNNNRRNKNDKITNDKELVKYMEEMYPYFAEQYNMNAMDALQVFSKDFKQDIQYYILGGGLSQIITQLETRVVKLGGIIKTAELVNGVTKAKNSGMYIINDKYQCLKIISSIPKTGIEKVGYLRELLGRKILNTIDCIPLYRIYAKYPNSVINGEKKVWFSGMDKMVVNHPLKFILPYGEKNGLIHISYTDGKYAKFLWKKMVDGSINSYLDKEVNKIFKNRIKGLEKIPEPEWVKHYYWECGMGCWKKGVNSKEIIKQVIKPIDKEEVYFCGENFSNQQAWMEGALFTANKVINLLNKKGKIKTKKITLKQQKGGSKGKKIKNYNMKEVSKHDTRKDAWTVINKSVYDITDWIDKHPGGDIIMKAVGKDATQLFKSIGHPDYVKKILKKMKIGVLI